MNTRKKDTRWLASVALMMAVVILLFWQIRPWG